MLKPNTCFGCPLYSKSNGFILPEGKGTNGVVIVGEYGEEEEYKDALPFRPKAQAGSKLEEAFRLAGVTRGQFYITNVLSCQPPNNVLSGAGYEMEAINHCYVNHLSKQLAQYTPVGKVKTILALGNIALRTLTGVSGLASEKQSIEHLRGYVLPSKWGNVVGSYHPSFLRRGKPNFTPVLVEDIRKAVRFAANNESTLYNSTASSYHPTYILASEFDAISYLRFLRESDPSKLAITYDIETVDTFNAEEDERDELVNGVNEGGGGGVEITQIQFSHVKGYGIIFPSLSGGYGRVVREIFKLPHLKAGFNCWSFDNPILRDKGYVDGWIKSHDLMWMFKHYHPNLERGLQKVASLFDFPFPWKHLALQAKADMVKYGGADVDSPQWILSKLPKLMKERGVWDGYEHSRGIGGYRQHVYELHSKAMQPASDRGIPVNEGRRLEVKEEFEQRLQGVNIELQELIPEELKNVEPKRDNKNKKKELKENDIIGVSYGYIKQPKEIRELKERYERARVKAQDTDRRIISFECWVSRVTGLSYRSFAEIVHTNQGPEQRIVDRWCRVNEFKPSLDQLGRYIRWKGNSLQIESEKCKENGEKDKARARELSKLSKLYVVPVVKKKNTEGVKEDKESTGKKVLEDLEVETGDRVLQLVREIRSIGTVINNFIPNWTPAKDGRVHTTWGYTAASGQFDSRSPNVLNCSKHTENGQEFRRIVEAPDGYTFIEADKKSYHVATMGYCANDRSYIRFSQLDPHSIFTSYIMPRGWGQPIDIDNTEDGEILERCGWIKKKCKQEKETKGDLGIDIRQQVAKPAVLGNQLGLGGRKLWQQNRRSIESEREAGRLQSVLAELFPKVHKYKDWIREKAWRDTYLINDWGYIQYFFDVFSFRYNKYKLSWIKVNGSDAEKCIAFPVQSTAFGEIKWNLLEMSKMGLLEEYGFINSIHDSVMFMCRDKLVEKAIGDINRVFARPCGVLINEATGSEGLRVGVEFSVGKNWKSWHKDSNPEGMRERVL